MQDKVNSLDDLKWSARHQIGDITISIVQGKGVQGSRAGNTFEVLAWDSDGTIPLSDSDVGSYFSDQDVLDLIHCISNWSYSPKGRGVYNTWAYYQRNLFPNALCNDKELMG